MLICWDSDWGMFHQMTFHKVIRDCFKIISDMESQLQAFMKVEALVFLGKLVQYLAVIFRRV